MTVSHPHFDLLESPISGRILVEASAGTGKTYTIAALCVRLIVEQRLEIEQLLVVTFTEAATAELRERIRRRLVEAVAVFSGSGADDFLTPLCARTLERDAARRRLQRALIAFDQAAIHTIHGFCQRILRDRAFEARALFDTELVTDLSDFEQRLADDFWRLHSGAFPPLFADFLLRQKFGPDRLFALQRSARRAETILPDAPATDLAAASAEAVALHARLRELWSAERGAIVADYLACAPGMRKGAFTPEKIESWARCLDRFFAGGSLWGGEPGIDKFAAPRANQGKPAPQHPFFALCADFAVARAELEDMYSAALLALQRDFLIWREAEAARRKAQLNLRTYDDLLAEVRDALTAPTGCGLLAALRDGYRAVLIDEFQDTDPIQYAIFSALCPDARSTLFLIGDPKQAIYAFRGADIFTYLEATRHVEHHFTLGINYRSAPALVDGVSAFFGREDPFLFAEIPYPAVRGSERNAALALIEGDGIEAPPLQLWFADRPEGKGSSQEAATTRIVAAVAAEIVRLLSQGARLRERAGEAGRPLSAGDIAVLVRSNRQAAAVQEALFACGVPAVRQGTESLFAAAEAEELLRLLFAIAEPTVAALARGALVTGLLDFAPEDLAQTVADPALLDRWLERLRDYHELWLRRGITALSGALFEREQLPARCLGRPDGERRLTNLRHAFEVLHCAESREHLGMEGLLTWFSRQIADPPEAEEYQLRLETDERAVQVVTIHRSKGLEYPVTFVPFSWTGSRPPANRKNAPFTFHAPTANGRGALTLDLGGSATARAAHRAISVREALAENLRLLYVALTRAQARTYLVWGRFNEAESSAPAWLLHGPEDVMAGEEVPQTEAIVKALDDAALRARLEVLGAGSGAQLVDLPLAAQAGRLPCAGERAAALAPLPPPSTIGNDWRLTSYSALAVGSSHLAEGEEWKAAEQGGAERTVPPDETEESGPSIHTFPRGAEAGSCLHDILETLDFTGAAGTERQALIEATLNRYAIPPGWSPVVDGMIERLLRVPLAAEAPALRLGGVPRSARCSEMGFFLPLERLRREELAAVFARHRETLPDPRIPELIAGLDFATVSGMLRGFIDLVFTVDDRYYLLDWKSNALGRSSSAYTPERMTTEMLASGYILQYHLYCVALHRHLGRTLPGYAFERHFGEVFYLFLRGIEASGATGIFRDRPAFALIDELDRLFAGTLSPAMTYEVSDAGNH